MKPLFPLIVCLGLVSLALVGCGDEKPTLPAAQSSASAEPLPAKLIAATQPAGEVLDVAAAKKSAKDGQPIVIRGKVAGSMEPLAKNRAMMTLLDTGIKTCDALPGDSCPTPWDACCEPADVLKASTATVQVVGPGGKPLRATLDGAGGIKPLKQVVIAGVVKTPPGSDVLVIEASQIYVQP